LHRVNIPYMTELLVHPLTILPTALSSSSLSISPPPHPSSPPSPIPFASTSLSSPSSTSFFFISSSPFLLHSPLSPPLHLLPCLYSPYSPLSPLHLHPSFAVTITPFLLQIIPSLLVVLDDFATPRVQTHAGAALVNFCEQCPKSILIKYLDSIVPKLENVLQVKLREVRKVSYLHFLLNSGRCK